LVDGVVDQQQRAGGERVPVVLIEGRDLHRTARHGAANVVQRPRRQGEQHRGRSREHQRRDRALIVGVHDVSGIDEAHAHASIVRRGDGGVVEVGLRGLDHRLVGVDHGAELIDLALLLVDDLLRGDVRFDQRVGALEVLARRDELRDVLRLFRLGLVERGLEQARVDLGQHVAFLDLLAFGEQHLLQLAVDLGMDADGERRLHRAEAGQVNWDVVALDDRDGDRHARACGHAGGMGSVGPLPAIPVAGAAHREDCKAGCGQNDAAAARRCSVPLCHCGDYPQVSPMNVVA